MTMPRLPLLLALALCAPLLAGCTTQAPSPDRDGLQEVASRGAAGPLEIDLAVPDPSAFHAAGAEVVLTVRASGERHVAAGIVPGDGVTLVSGNTSFEGTVREGEPRVLRAVLKGAPGERLVRGFAESSLGPASRAAPSAVLAFTEGPDARSISASLDSRALDLQVELAADPEDATRLLATLTSPVATDVRLVLDASGLGLAEGSSTWEGRLEAGTAKQLAWTLAAPADGTYHVAAYVLPDARVDGGVYSDGLYLLARDGGVTASEREPGSQPGDAAEPAPESGTGTGERGNATQPG